MEGPTQKVIGQPSQILRPLPSKYLGRNIGGVGHVSRESKGHPRSVAVPANAELHVRYPFRYLPCRPAWAKPAHRRPWVGHQGSRIDLPYLCSIPGLAVGVRRRSPETLECPLS